MRSMQDSWKKLQETMFTPATVLTSCQICSQRFLPNHAVSEHSQFNELLLITMCQFSIEACQNEITFSPHT